MEQTWTPRSRSKITVFRTSISDRARAIDPPDNDGVTGLSVIERLLHAWPLERGAAFGSDIGEHVALLVPAAISASSCNSASWLDVLRRV